MPILLYSRALRIINGIGYDFQQRTWESFERDADAKGYYLTVLAEAKIIYSRNEADRQRFLYLRAKLMANLADFNYMFQRGLEWLDNAMELYKTMAFETGLCKMRKAVGYISDSLCMAVACLNQTYFKGFNQLEELKRMKHIPQDFLVYCQQMLQNSDEEALKSIAYRMIQTTRKLFYSMEPRIAPAVVHPDYTYVAESVPGVQLLFSAGLRLLRTRRRFFGVWRKFSDANRSGRFGARFRYHRVRPAYLL